MIEHYILLGLAAFGGALLFCWLLYWVFKRFDNPFDDLDEEDVEAIDSAVENIASISGVFKHHSP